MTDVKIINMMKTKRCIFNFMILVFIAFTSCKNKITLYVAESGSDKSVGSVEQPLGTLQKAIESAREIRKSNGNTAVSILVRKGTYYLESPLTFLTDDSGNETIPFTISAYPGEQPVVSGGRRLELKWLPFKEGIFMAETEKNLNFDQLFINGEKQILARYPDFDPSIEVWNGYAADADSPARLATYKHPKGAFIHKMHPGLWGGFHFRIMAIRPDGQPELEGGYQNNRVTTSFHPTYKFIENVFEELNSPREWYYDADNGILYYKPAQGFNLNTALVEIPLLENCISFKGTQQNPVHDIAIKGLIFKHTLRTFMKTRESLLRSDWTIYRQGMVFFEGSERITVENCEFDSPGGNAIFLSNYNRTVNIAGNYIHDAGAGGINFVGNPSAVRSPLFEYGQSNNPKQIDTIKGPKNSNFPAECQAFDNLIRATGRLEKQTAGVNICMAQDITISHNSIYNVSRAGINICAGTWGGHIIEFNDVFNTVLETGDHGSFNSWGRDRYWFPIRDRMDSLAAANPNLIKLDACKTTILRNNRWRCDRGWDIDLDDGSSNYLLENNLCLNGGIKLREGFYRKVVNNIMVNNTVHLHAWFKNSGDVIQNNIVCTPFKPIYITDWGKGIDYNLFATKFARIKAMQTGTDEHSVSGDPMFINAAKGDFRVDQNSPALKVGFKNFDMSSFGVVSIRLREIALLPIIPVLNILNIAEESDQVVVWRGAKIKKLKGMPEMSATGMTSEAGILILHIEPTSPLTKYGIKVNDVIMKVNGKITNSLQDFFYYYDEESWVHSVKLGIFRNQQTMELELEK